MVFSTIQILFLQRLAQESLSPSRRRSSSAALHLSEHHGLGTRVGSWVEYRADHIQAARSLLRANDLPVEALPQDASRADVAMYGGLSEKGLGKAPHADSIAVRCIGNCTLDGEPLRTPEDTYLVCRSALAVRISCERLMVVENLETFRELETYRWINYKGRSVLAIYRGDIHLSPALALRCILARSEPLWAFVDFDPAGLTIANALPSNRLERIVLPDQAWLSQAAMTSVGRSLYDSQLAQARGPLSRTTNAEIEQCWRELQRLKGAVTQERMRSAPS